MDDLFDIQDHVVLTNPTQEPFTWRVGGVREYTIEPGQLKRTHGSAARLYVKHMTDMLIIKSNQTQQLHSKELRDEMAQSLIVRVIKDGTEEEPEEVPTKEQKEQTAKETDISPITEPDSPKVEKVSEPEFPEVEKKQDVEAVKSTAKSKTASE